MTDLIEILDNNNIYYESTNNPTEVLIRCTSGDHSDNHPSLTYNLDKNIFYCFTCGFKGGSVKFLESIGITNVLSIDSKQEYKILKLKNKLRKIRNVDSIKIPTLHNLFHKEFNGINNETIKEFKAFTTSELGLEEYICIPIYQFKRLKFIDARVKLLASGKPKYLRKPANIVSNDILFPIDKITYTNTIILVEGIYDMLNLWQHGVKNVLCIFGAANFGPKKIELLDKLGITNVLVMMDGDSAGKNAATRISNELDKNNILSTTIYLKPNQDPGNLTLEEIKIYLERFNQ